jgi:hypothetical protein
MQIVEVDCGQICAAFRRQHFISRLANSAFFE